LSVLSPLGSIRSNEYIEILADSFLSFRDDILRVNFNEDTIVLGPEDLNYIHPRNRYNVYVG